MQLDLFGRRYKSAKTVLQCLGINDHNVYRSIVRSIKPYGSLESYLKAQYPEYSISQFHTLLAPCEVPHDPNAAYLLIRDLVSAYLEGNVTLGAGPVPPAQDLPSEVLSDLHKLVKARNTKQALARLVLNRKSHAKE